jgi:hypothetical protein
MIILQTSSRCKSRLSYREARPMTIEETITISIAIIQFSSLSKCIKIIRSKANAII